MTPKAIDNKILQKIEKTYSKLALPQGVEDPCWLAYVRVTTKKFGAILQYYNYLNVNTVTFTKCSRIFNIEEEENKEDYLQAFQRLLLRFFNELNGLNAVDHAKTHLERTVTILDFLDWITGVDYKSCMPQIELMIQKIWKTSLPKSRDEIRNLLFDGKTYSLNECLSFLFSAPTYMKLIYHILEDEKKRRLPKYVHLMYSEYIQYLADCDYKYPSMGDILERIRLPRKYIPELGRVQNDAVETTRAYLRKSLRNKKIEPVAQRKASEKKMKKSFQKLKKRTRKHLKKSKTSKKSLT